jgi:hypothetical protein
MWRQIKSIVADARYILKSTSDAELHAVWKKRKEAEVFLQHVKDETSKNAVANEARRTEAIGRLGRAIDFQKTLEKRVASTSEALWDGPAAELTEEQQAGIQAKAVADLSTAMASVHQKSALVAFYQKHCADKVDTCDDLLTKFPIDMLANALHEKYGEVPEGWESHVGKPKPESS